MTSAQAGIAEAEASQPATRSRTIVWSDPGELAAAGAGLSGLELFTAIAEGELPPPPMAVLMRMKPVEWGPDRAVFEGEPAEEHYNPIGVVHGGYTATLLDSAMGCAVHTTLPAGAGYTTLSLEVKFVRPTTTETNRVRAEADVVHRGRTQATAEGRLVAADTGKLIAHATTTCLILGA